MNNDGLVAGTNFDSNLFGFEAEPLELVLDIIEELKRTGKTINLVKFENIQDMETQIKDVLSS
ncbi:Uncharacterised protein [Chryseobacterium carnipullorum]|nr:hypothetical protein [Chryseobacterium carnipullorum]STC96299.1 Uncharacterised protein [Chryseobacterium carnipullorum]